MYATQFKHLYTLELLGQINERQIFYSHIRSDDKWFDSISFDNWIAFTIADNEDKELLHDMTVRCIDKGVCYSCSAGQLGSLTEDYFDEEISWRQVQHEERTGEPQDYEATPMTSFHKNFDEGFWFAAAVAQQIINDVYVTSHQIVCIDCTQEKVRNHLINLIAKINDGWLPPDNEFQKPVYDTNKTST